MALTIGDSDLCEAEYLECLVKTSDNIFSNIQKEKWTEEMFAKERRGNAKQGYIILCKDSPAEWGKLEKDPSRFAIVKIKKSEFNKEWLEPEYDLTKPILDKQGEETGEYHIKTLRKYRLPLENFLSETELNDLKSIKYNQLSEWSFEKTIDNAPLKVKIGDFENRPTDLKLHGSSGTFNIRSSGGDYTSLSAWEAGEQADLTDTGPCIAEITEGFEDTTALTIQAGWTTTVDDYIKVYTTSAARHNGKWDATAYRLVTDPTDPITISENNVKIDGLQVKNANSSSGMDVIYCGVATTGIEFSNCIVVSTYGSGTGIGFYNSSITAKIWNCVIYLDGTQSSFSQGIYADYASTVAIYNCVVYNWNDGIERDVGTVTVTNTAVFNCGTDFDGSMTVDHCASDDGTGTNVVQWLQGATDWANVFVDYANGDFHLKDFTGTGAIIDQGTDDPGSGLYADDIDGDTRVSPWDIGADEYVSEEPPVGAIMNQFQGANLGADLFNGTLL